MALSEITLNRYLQGQASAPIFIDVITCRADSDYDSQAGGMPEFSRQFERVPHVGQRIILQVLQSGLCGGYQVYYDVEQDSLRMYSPAGDEVSSGDYSSVELQLTVLSK